MSCVSVFQAFGGKVRRAFGRPVFQQQNNEDQKGWSEEEALIEKESHNPRRRQRCRSRREPVRAY